MLYQNKKRKSVSTDKRFFLIIGAIALLIIGGSWLAFYALSQNSENEAPVATSSSSSTKGEKPAPNSQDNQTPTSPNKDTTPSQDQPTADPNATLIEPSGNFVSNHHPNLDGSPAPNQMQSVCNTTPGASCVIIFTKDSVTKQLAAKVADAGGSAYWSWTLQDLGLAEGSWQVSATATLGSQTKSQTDATVLEVGP